MSWPVAVCAALAALILFYAPGMAVGYLAGVRRLELAALAPPITTAVFGVGAIVMAWIGVRWSLLSAAGVTLVVGAIAYVMKRLLAAKADFSLVAWGRARAIAICVVLALCAAIIPAVIGMGSPDALLQKWDGVFHENLVQYMRDTGDASTLDAGIISNTVSAHSYYPAGWHTIVALVPSSFSTLGVVNMAALVSTTVVWVVSVLYLMKVLFPTSVALAAAGALVSSIYQATPSAMWQGYGHIPNAYGTAMLPALLAGVCRLLAWYRERSPGRIQFTVIMAVAIAGGAFAHPNTVFSLVVLAAPPIAIAVAAGLRALWRSARKALAVIAGSTILGLVTVGCVVVMSSAMAQSVMDFSSSSKTNFWQAILNGLMDTTSSWHFGPNVAIAVLIVVGIWRVLRIREHRWLLVSFAFTVVLYAGASGGPAILRRITGLWYNDPVRLGSLIPVVGIPICALGLVYLTGIVVGAWHAIRSTHTWPAGFSLGGSRVLAAGCIAVVALGSVTQVAGREQRAALPYSTDVSATRPVFVTSDEEAMMKSLDGKLDPDGVVLGDPFNGSAQLYAMLDQPVVFTHVLGTWNEDQMYLAQHFNELTTNPEVCTVLNSMNVEYFYYDTMRYGFNLQYPGLDYGIDTSKGMTEIAHGGTASIYQITACG